MTNIDHIENDDAEVDLFLDRWRVAARKVIEDEGGTFGETLEIMAKKFDFGNQLGVGLSSLVFTENVTDFKYPFDWWQAFKERWFPNLFLKLWPVKYRKFEIKALYPKLQFPYYKYNGGSKDEAVFKIIEKHRL